MTLEASGTEGRCNSIKVSGNDIYMCGLTYTSEPKTTYWKNGTKQFQDSITSGYSIANSIFLK